MLVYNVSFFFKFGKICGIYVNYSHILKMPLYAAKYEIYRISQNTQSQMHMFTYNWHLYL